MVLSQEINFIFPGCVSNRPGNQHAEGQLAGAGRAGRESRTLGEADFLRCRKVGTRDWNFIILISIHGY